MIVIRITTTASPAPSRVITSGTTFAHPASTAAQIRVLKQKEYLILS